MGTDDALGVTVGSAVAFAGALLLGGADVPLAVVVGASTRIGATDAGISTGMLVAVVAIASCGRTLIRPAVAGEEATCCVALIALDAVCGVSGAGARSASPTTTTTAKTKAETSTTGSSRFAGSR